MVSEKAIENFSLFKCIHEDTLSTIAQNSKLDYHKKGTIFYSNFRTRKPYFYYIVRGWVKVFSSLPQGMEIIHDILTDANYFNEALLFEKNVESLNLEAISDIRVILIPIPLLRECLHQDYQLALNLLKKSLQKQRELTYEIEHLSIQSAAQRIGCFLLRLCPSGKEKAITLHLPYDKGLIALRLGLRPETFSRALTALSRQCCIKIKREFIFIDKIDYLKQYVCKQCSLIYPCQATLPLSKCDTEVP